MNERDLALLMQMLQERGPLALGVADGEWRRTTAGMNPPVAGSLPEVPAMHDGQLFNLAGRQWTDGRATSLDFSLQPYIDRNSGKVGIGGAHLLYRMLY